MVYLLNAPPLLLDATSGFFVERIKISPSCLSSKNEVYVACSKFLPFCAVKCIATIKISADKDVIGYGYSL